MKRFRRWTYYLLAWMLLLACPAMWAASYARHDGWLWLRGHRWSPAIMSAQGRLSVIVTRYNTADTQPPELIHVSGEIEGWLNFPELTPPVRVVATGVGGGGAGGPGLFGGGSYEPPPWFDFSQDDLRLNLPWWFLSTPGLLWIAAIFFQQIRRWRRPRLGRCACCGYDLRASPDRCPECGTPVPPVASASAAG